LFTEVEKSVYNIGIAVFHILLIPIPQACVNGARRRTFATLAGRPGERTTGQNMNMNVKNRLAGAGAVIDHHAVPFVTQSFLFRNSLRS
jgi:hypothetical protein